MRAGHIVYVGFLSGLCSFSDYAFSASRLTLGMSFDELIDTKTGDLYSSDAASVTDSEISYTDCGWLSSFSGPADNRFVVIAGTRDEALMSIAATAADLQEIRTLVAELPEQPGDLKPAFEALYRVSSRDRTHLASRRIFTSIIDDRRVWTEQSD